MVDNRLIGFVRTDPGAIDQLLETFTGKILEQSDLRFKEIRRIHGLLCVPLAALHLMNGNSTRHETVKTDRTPPTKEIWRVRPINQMPRLSVLTVERRVTLPESWNSGV
jgi:hypothetical protein